MKSIHRLNLARFFTSCHVTEFSSNSGVAETDSRLLKGGECPLLSTIRVQANRS